MPFTLPFDSDRAELAQVGGKGANLARMYRAGLPVPDGFLITTGLYRLFVAENGLETVIDRALAELSDDSPAALEQAAQVIRVAFSAGAMPPEAAQEIVQRWRGLGSPAVAVRSSATAEDLPEMSFAGQQDTYLNVNGEDALLRAVVQCWGSLWTARAIGYRRRNNVAQHGVALAVVVQVMVDSEASGVLFTANPLNGVRAQTVIDAAFGLGEALVSGQVEPDQYIVDVVRQTILRKALGKKALLIRGRSGGGTETVSLDAATQQALNDDQILRLADLGRQVADLYQPVPQDIEWGLSDGQFLLLQSRPITSLFPIPEELPADPLQVLFSFGAVQGMLDPITPFGRDMMRMFIGAAAQMMMRQPLTYDTQKVLYSAGERLWINITPIVRNTVGRKVIHVALAFIEPSARQALLQVWDDPRLLPGRRRIRPRTLWLLVRFYLPIVHAVFLNILEPAGRREFIQQSGEDMLRSMRERAAGIAGSPLEKLQQRVKLAPGFVDMLPPQVIRYLSGVVTGMFSLMQFDRQARAMGNPDIHSSPWHSLTLALTRGLPNNPTTEMDLALWRMARAIRADPPSLALFETHSASILAASYLQGGLPPVAQAALRGFLDQYGGRGLAEIDAGRPRWVEDPTYVIESLIGYLGIVDDTRAPDVVFAQGAVEAVAAQRALEQLARKKRFGVLRAARVRFFARRARELLGLRELPKFFAVRALEILRSALLESGRELHALGLLDQPDDLFYLSFSDLNAFAHGSARDWRVLIAENRQRYQRELLRRQIPRLMLSDGHSFYEGLSALEGAADELLGSPVSPGTVEGSVRVVLDPRQSALQPGEILVCPGTDPSWTPLFLIAGGLIMEVGGMMTHGAVVAREYGIPAIVGVDRATERLQTGQCIRVDGSTGRIEVLEPQGSVQPE